MVPPQHYPASFPQEFSSARTPTMMTPDSSADTRSDRLSLDMGSIHQHQLQQHQHRHHHQYNGLAHSQDYSHQHQHHPQLHHNQAYPSRPYHSPPYPLLPTPMEEHGQTPLSNTIFEHRSDQPETGGPQSTEIVSAPGGRLKRESRHVSVDISPTTSGTIVTTAKDAAGMPAKKKAKTESSKKSENDTASLFQKIYEDDSDFEDTKMDSNDEDEDMIMPDDAASEDEVKPEQQEALNDEQDLLTVLWQWSCVCCPSKDGAFRRLIPEDPSGGWVHVVCALWLPETTLGDPDNVDKISVRDIPEKNWNLTCYLCKDSVDAALGACVQCDAGQCRKSFHITCAQSFSLLETLEDSDMADPYFMYCKQHGSTDGQAKLNGWAKWVKQRDAFLGQWQADQSRKRTQRLLDMQQQQQHRRPGQDGQDDEDEDGEGLIELFEHSYSRFKQARERRIARERSELSRQYSIGYYLGNKIDKTRSRLDVISSKAEQALQEQKRIETYTRNLLSSLLECAKYLENISSEELVGETPLSIDTTLAWYNSLPDSSRWKGSIQDIIQTIDLDSMGCDHPYSQPGGGLFSAGGVHGPIDSGFDDSEGCERQGRSSKGVYGKMTKKGKSASNAGATAKSKKVHPKPTLTNKSQIPVVFTSSRGRLIKRDYPDYDDSPYASSTHHYGTHRQQQHTGNHSPGAYSSSNGHSGIQHQAKRPIVPCTVCHQLTLPEEKLALERDADGMLTPMAIKVLNRMVTCDTCQRPFHPKCLDPPMARVPPRGYSWNCEDCDPSDDSEISSSAESPATANQDGGHSSHHHHSQSSDMDEALMFLADTALTVSTTAYGPTGAVASNSGRKSTTTHGLKRTHQATTIRMPDPADPSVFSKSKMSKKAKIEGGVTRRNTTSKTAVVSDDEDEDSEDQEECAKPSKPRAIQLKGSSSTTKPGSVAPIIRGNLRIYPPGPHVAPKVSSTLLSTSKNATALQEQTSKNGHKEVATKKTKGKAAADSTDPIDSTVATTKTKGSAASKKDKDTAKAKATAALNKTSKAKTESVKTVKATVSSKAKKSAEEAAATSPAKAKGTKAGAAAAAAAAAAAVIATEKRVKGTSKDAVVVKSEAAEPDAKATKRRKSVSIATSSPTSPTSPGPTTGSGKEKTVVKATVRRGSVPAVVPQPPAPAKEVIRYTVGEKTVEELMAKEDVEIERRDNVKFRKLRGRTLTMPAPPQDGIGAMPATSVESTSTTSS
ncbi:PHD finger protein 14 [Gryganskiella cystojenkinii]|nr:PHD finger protein 14 [Gryganskiella cystojenkinii]